MMDLNIILDATNIDINARKEALRNIFRQLVIDSLEEDPINTLKVLRKKIGEL